MLRPALGKQLALLLTRRTSGAAARQAAGHAADRDAALHYAASLLTNARAEIDRADAKASILLAASGVGAGAVLAGLIAGTWTPLRLQPAAQWLWWAGAAGAAAGICCLAWVVYPREPRRETQPPWAVGFHGDVLAFRTTPQLMTALSRSAEASLEQVADQLRQVSRIVHVKYRLIRWGMWMLFLAIATASAAVVIDLVAR